jgi:acyl-CoA synthetase (AMP-forming)/AMP-acid ligase II/acyl carrier protein
MTVRLKSLYSVLMGHYGPIQLAEAMRETGAGSSAIVSPGGPVISYYELAARLNRLTHSLRVAGLAPGDRVVTVLPEGAATAQLILALTGLVACCPLNPMLTEQEYARGIALVRPRAVLVREERSPRARSAAQAAGVAIIEVGGDDTEPKIGEISGPLRAPDAAAPLPPGLLLATSGTTGTAKLARIPWATMQAGAQASARAYRLTAHDRRLNIMPLFHIQGVVGSVLASLVSGGSVSCAPSFSPADVTRSWLDEVTWFSATPAMHQQIMDAADPSWRPAPSLRFVRCGSAGLPSALRTRLEDFYGVPVVESYGMTEAHQIASSPLPPDTALGMVAAVSRIAVEVSPGVIATEPGHSGQILVHGDNVIPGYLDTDQGADDADSFVDGWFRTGDQGELLADGSLKITGRIRELIIRGGENIVPLEVEEVLRSHPAVRDACVCGFPDPALGERVAAAVTLTRAGAADTGVLRAFAAGKLAPFKVPEVVVEYSAFPVTGSGKVARAQIARQLAATAAQQRPRAADDGTGAEAVRDVMLAMWRQVLRDDAIGPDDDFYVAGGDSLGSVTLLAAVAERFGVEISPLTMFDEASTAARMAAYIDRHGRASGGAA